ncbi:hypothetical protein ZOSMA_127G00280 [Zostera marina]|uniref:MMS19 nucleotide excision repair protein n=1 Tax=Zostera marina TaxID=29655 RepID=A0A0K9Q1U9_ZOSMR|nr:hypothetical protein ZOSMA_127G00280 [Zostera marina]
MTMKVVVGNLNKENQLLIMHKGYNIIQSRIISPLRKLNQFLPDNTEIARLDLDSIILSPYDELLVSLFAAVVVALQPQVVISDIKVIINVFSIYLLKGHVSEAHALGSIFNKWPSNSKKADEISCRLKEAIDIIFTKGVFSSDIKLLRINDDIDANNAVHMNVIVGLDKDWYLTREVPRSIHLHQQFSSIIIWSFCGVCINPKRNTKYTTNRGEGRRIP